MPTDDVETFNPDGPLPFEAAMVDALLAHSADVVLVVDGAATIRYVSPSAPRLFGYALGTNLGRSGVDLVHPDDRARTWSALVERAESDAARPPFSVRLAHAAGGWRDCEIVATNLLDDEKVAGIVLNVRDVTDRRLTERALEESERWFRQIVETADEGVWTIDADSITTFVNPRLAEMFGLPAQEMIGAYLMEFMEDDARAEAERNLERRRQGISEHHDFRFRRADGGELLVTMSTSPLFDADGVYAGALALVTDVTERRAAERALRNAELERQQALNEAERRRLEIELARAQRLESIGRLAGGIAHDFNNLLGVILNYSVLVERRFAASDPVVGDIQRIQAAVAQAADLTKRLLVFARADAEVDEVTFDVTELVREVTDLVERPFGKTVVLRCEFATESLPVRADRGRLAQVLMNLLLNARDAIPDGGVITLVTDRDNRGWVRVEVADDGVGMTTATVRRAFEPFFTTKPLTHGSGLGLSTAHSVVNQAGGTIELDSAPGIGTRVLISLPPAT
jgi:two-component system, cell cycle sensor histidine kinase and response regulator CckA